MARSALSLEEGRLRLQRDVLEYFAAWGPDISRLDPATRLDLDQAGIVVDETLHPFVATVAESWRDPQAALTISSLIPPTQAAGGCLSEGAVVLALPSLERDLFDIVVMPKVSLARALAHLIGLGPRPRGDGEMRIPASAWEEARGDGATGSVLEALNPDQAKFLSSVTARWVVEFVDTGSGRGRRLDIADLNGRGWWLAQPAPASDLVELHAVAASDVWALLTSLLD